MNAESESERAEGGETKGRGGEGESSTWQPQAGGNVLASFDFIVHLILPFAAAAAAADCTRFCGS